MDDRQWLAERFEEQRPRLRTVAYRMLGSLTEADDAIQDAWLRLSGTGAGEIDNLGGWLTTVVARVCLNMLRSRRTHPETSLDGHLPDPIVTLEGALEPEQEALLADSVGLALLVVLDSLSPAERLAFVLHDMFDLPFEHIAPMVGRTPTAARQLASRARRRVRGAAPAPDPDLRRQRQVVDASRTRPPRTRPSGPPSKRSATRSSIRADHSCSPRASPASRKAGRPARTTPPQPTARTLRVAERKIWRWSSSTAACTA